MGLFTDNIDSSEVLNEVYFGQTPGITKVFEAFSAFRSKYVNSRKVLVGNIDADHDPLLGKFISEVEREFGFYSFSFVCQFNDEVNMCTIVPFFRGSDPKKCVQISKDGFKFKKEAEVSGLTIAPAGMLLSEDYTDREMFAIFLHEIGHNFQDFLNGTIMSCKTVNDMLLIYGLIVEACIRPVAFIKDVATLSIVNNYSLKILSKAFNKISISQNRTFISYINFVGGICSIATSAVKQVLGLTTLPIMLIYAAVRELIGSAMNPVQAVRGYLGEKFSDDFPSYYGFGPDITSALRKLGIIDGTKTGVLYAVNKIPLISHFYNLLLLPGTILLEISDCHPSSPARVKGVVNSMRHDLQNPSLSPKLKAQLKKELDLVESQTEDYYNNLKKTDPAFLKKVFDKYIFYACDGGAKHKFFTKVFDFENDNTKSANNLREQSFIANIEVK